MTELRPFCLTGSVLVLSLLSAVCGVWAAELPEEAIEVAAKVKITRAEGQRILAVTLTAKDGKVYHLITDEKGADLARVMFGMTVKIVGIASRKGGKEWLRAIDYQSVADTSAHELWRRSRCNACVVTFASQHSAVPRELHGATPIGGRLFPLKRKFTACTRDARFLWAATDNAIYQVDLQARRVVRSYGKREGLPGHAVYDVASDGDRLFIVHHGGVALLKIGGEAVVDQGQLKSAFARPFVAADRTWLIADTGTYCLKAGSDLPESFPPLPTAGRIATAIRKGIWLPDWKRTTAYFVVSPAALGDRLYVSSFGSVYELDGGTWKRVPARASVVEARAERIWLLDPKGLVEYDPKTGNSQTHSPPGVGEGRFTGLLVTDLSAWVTAEPKPGPAGREYIGGGVARFSFGTGTWQTWQTLGGMPAGHASCFQGEDGAIWVVTMAGTYRDKSAHPGMAYVKKKIFEATDSGLHRLGRETVEWQSTSLPMARIENRFICGQDGGGGKDWIVLQSVKDLCVGPKRVLATVRLFPERYFSGYWPSISQIASRTGDGPWTGQFIHHPDQLNLQGEQPRCLNISNKGVMVLKAVAHDDVLSQFLVDGVHWAVTEGCIAFLDEEQNRWHKVMETGFRWYWRATAALDDGGSLYVGSDRGLVSRLDFGAGQFELLGALQDRAVARIGKNDEGDIVVIGRPPPIGMLPVQMPKDLRFIDADVAKFDGENWREGLPSDLPAEAASGWSVEPIQQGKNFKSFLRDKSVGNFLWGPVAGRADPQPRLYVREVYCPRFLCLSPDGNRMWLSTYTGLLRLEPERQASDR